MSEADTVSPADVAGLNQAVVARGADLARKVSTGLFVVAGLGVLAWAWVVLRGLGIFGDVFDDFDGGPELAYRLDFLAARAVVLVNAALAAGLGVALRLAADYTVARTGGTLTGVRAGEPLAASAEGRRPKPVPRPSAPPGK